MQIQIGQTRDEKNKLDKSFTASITLNGELTTDSNVVSPSIIVNYNADYIASNYCYIPAWGRYYFIEDITVSGKMMTLHLHVDVLKSFSGDIKNSRATITRSSRGNVNIADARAKATERTIIQYRTLGTPFRSAATYVIVKGV
mgnify:CR=1 FL=1